MSEENKAPESPESDPVQAEWDKKADEATKMREAYLRGQVTPHVVICWLLNTVCGNTLTREDLDSADEKEAARLAAAQAALDAEKAKHEGKVGGKPGA